MRAAYVDVATRHQLAMAALRQDPAGRALSTLRSTYRAWDIDREPDGYGQTWWVARLRQRLTPRARAAGVMQVVRRPDAIALCAALARQWALLYNAQHRPL
jgi:hypothetical protein